MSLCFLSLPLLYLSAPLYRKNSLKEKSPIPLLSFSLKFTSFNSNLLLFPYTKTVLIKITSKSYAKHRSVFTLMFLDLSAYLAGSLLPPPYHSVFAWLREHHILGLPPVSEWRLCFTVSAAPHSMSPDIGGARAQHLDPSSSLAYLIPFIDLTRFHYSVHPYTDKTQLCIPSLVLFLKCWVVHPAIFLAPVCGYLLDILHLTSPKWTAHVSLWSWLHSQLS